MSPSVQEAFASDTGWTYRILAVRWDSKTGLARRLCKLQIGRCSECQSCH